MNELTRRILFAIPAGALFLYLIWVGGIAFQALTAFIALMVLVEMLRMFRNLTYPAYSLLAILIAVVLWTFPYQPAWGIMTASAIFIIATLWALVNRSKTISNRWFITLFCGLYAPLGMLFFYLVRESGADEAGLWLSYTLILMIWGNDIFAYFGGRSFGKTPLAPKISPKKTWEGFWSGFAGAFIGLLIVYWIADPYPVSMIAALPMIALVSVFGPAGDLTASRLKRVTGIKDSSNLLPGHGGFLDRFDSLIICAPIVYIYIQWLI